MKKNIYQAKHLLFTQDILFTSTNVIAVVGCGGKTTLINNLASAYKNLKVLISPTTKIMPMEQDEVILCTTLETCKKHIPKIRIQCLGIKNRTTGKLEALPEELLSKIYMQYDLVLLEADGSRGYFCKGWQKNEPVIPNFATCTVGIVTMNKIGKKANETNVLRLPEFLDLTGLNEGDIITEEALIKMVCGKNGMFKNAIGKKYLFVNQIENSYLSNKAKKWLNKIHTKYSHKFVTLTYGTARKNEWRKV